MQLMHETLADALLELIQAIGGPKEVGKKLYPELAADTSGNKVRACLDEDRRERFSPDQLLMLARMGRQIGCHSLMTFMLRESGYADPQPIEPEDEIARLQRDFVEATKSLHTMATRIESIAATASLRRVA